MKFKVTISGLFFQISVIKVLLVPLICSIKISVTLIINFKWSRDNKQIVLALRLKHKRYTSMGEQPLWFEISQTNTVLMNFPKKSTLLMPILMTFFISLLILMYIFCYLRMNVMLDMDSSTSPQLNI